MFEFIDSFLSDPGLVIIGLVLLFLAGIGVWLLLLTRRTSIQETHIAPPPVSRRQPAEDSLRAEVITLIQQGNKMEAIRHYRQATGLGLNDSLQAIQRIESSAGSLEEETSARGYYPSQAQELEDQVREALARGNKIEAITIYRKATNAGLKEAKDAVEALEGNKIPPASQPPAQSPIQLRAQVEAHLRQGNKIEAIRLYRQHTNLSLKEAKDAVEQIERALAGR